MWVRINLTRVRVMAACDDSITCSHPSLRNDVCGGSVKVQRVRLILSRMLLPALPIIIVLCQCSVN